MKNYIFKTLIFFFLIINSYSQSNSGQIIYKIKTNVFNFNDDNLPASFDKFVKKTDDVISKLEFVMKFNRNNSLFHMRKKMNLDSNEFHMKMAVLSTRGNSVFYTDNNNKSTTEQTQFLGEDFLIKSSFSDLEWKLSKEKKTISNYVCYKATTKKENSGPLNEQKKYSNYVAWYCPELSFNYGPYEISGLPGLVLEFSNEKLTYYVSEIKLSDKQLVLDEIKKGKIVSKKEFEQIGKDAYENAKSFRN